MVRLHCQARYDIHPRRQCNVHSPNLQLDNGGGSSHTCSLLDCFGKQSHMHSTGLLWEAVTHALYWTALGSDSRTTHAILLTVSGMDLRVSLFARTLSEDWKATAILQGCIFIYPHLVTAKLRSAIWEQGLTPHSRINGLATKGGMGTLQTRTCQCSTSDFGNSCECTTALDRPE